MKKRGGGITNPSNFARGVNGRSVPNATIPIEVIASHLLGRDV